MPRPRTLDRVWPALIVSAAALAMPTVLWAQGGNNPFAGGAAGESPRPGIGATSKPPATRPAGAAPAAPALADPAAEKARKERGDKINAALQALTQEANDIGEVAKLNAKVTFSRPHPALAGLGPEMAPDLLARMLAGFTSGEGKEFKDAYIRWHLMHLIKQASQADRRDMGPKLVQIIRQTPDKLEVEPVSDTKYEPPEVWGRYIGLVNSQLRTVGYPPFQRQIGAPESYQYMTPEEAGQVKANLEEAETLRDKFQVIVDKNARAWNLRIRDVNYLIRQYRGELIYALLQTGDPEMARLVMTEVDRQVRAGQGVAFDLLAFVYLAAFDGYLNQYDARLLRELGAQLKRSAIAAEGYVEYHDVKRNFADYAFHMVHMLEDPGGVIDPKGGDPGPGTGKNPR